MRAYDFASDPFGRVGRQQVAVEVSSVMLRRQGDGRRGQRGRVGLHHPHLALRRVRLAALAA